MTELLAVEATGVTKTFGPVLAVDDITVRVAAGEVYGVLGPNGAGKTTLFNMISGDLRLDAGELMFSGVALRHEPPYKRCQRGIGRTYQIPKPYGAMTTFENLLVAAMFGASRSERDAYDHCAAILDDCGLGDKANVPAGALTLLNRKRLEMARALATDPKLLLLDEVMAGLRPTETDRMVSILRELNRDSGLTILLIEHVMRAVMALASRVLVLHHGGRIAEGAPEEVVRDPAVIHSYLGAEEV